MNKDKINQLKEDLLVALHSEEDLLEAKREGLIVEIDSVNDELYRIQDLIYKLS